MLWAKHLKPLKHILFIESNVNEGISLKHYRNYTTINKQQHQIPYYMLRMLLLRNNKHRILQRHNSKIIRFYVIVALKWKLNRFFRRNIYLLSFQPLIYLGKSKCIRSDIRSQSWFSKIAFNLLKCITKWRVDRHMCQLVMKSAAISQKFELSNLLRYLWKLDNEDSMGRTRVAPICMG